MALVSQPPAEIESTIQQAITACRVDKMSAPCTNALTLCKTVRGTAQADLPGINELCATRPPTWLWWTLSLVAVGGLTVGGVAVYRRYRRVHRAR